MVTLAMEDDDIFNIKECDCGKHAYCNCATRVRLLPPFPTDAIPGTEEKIQVMRERWANGYALHHPCDLRLSSKGVECFTGLSYLSGVVMALEQMRMRGVK